MPAHLNGSPSGPPVPHCLHCSQVYAAFVYYATAGSGDPYHMALNSYTSFLDDCSIADSESQ